MREGCRHVFYVVAFKVEKNRSKIASVLQNAGVPVKEGYVEPLYHLPAFSKFKQHCPVAEDMHNNKLLCWENCAWSPTTEQLKQIGEAFHRAIDESQRSA